MSSAAPSRRLATVDDLLAIPENERFHEIIDGELVRKAMPSLRHGTAQAELAAEIAGAYGLRARGLVVYRWTAEGYLLVLTAQCDERVRAEPFDAVELSVHGLLAGDEE